MTKTQAKSQLKKILDTLATLTSDLENLQCDVEETIDCIEPYEGCNELTAEQEERQEWFEELQSMLEEITDNANDAYSKVEETIEY